MANATNDDSRYDAIPESDHWPRPLARRLERARRYGFTARESPQQTFVGKAGSHDDGPGHGAFLGPIGGPAFSRDIDGRFNRWHLEPGSHVLADIEQCQLRVRWVEAGVARSIRLCRADVDSCEVRGLFPYWHEIYGVAGMPFRVVLSAFSPLIAGDDAAAGLPVVCFDVWLLADRGRELPATDVALFWANLNGWQASRVSTLDRADRAWPGHHHAGNRNRAAAHHAAGTAVLQGRDGDLRGPAGVTGEVAVSVLGPSVLGSSMLGAGARYSRQVQFKTDQNATGVTEHLQPYTFQAVRHAFDTGGRLGSTPDDSWSAHWHEPVGSAVAAHHPPGGAQARTRFVLAFDWPHVVFGQGRTWRRSYRDTAAAGPPGAGALAIAERAHRDADGWTERIDAWQDERLGSLHAAGWSDGVAGCVLNETGLLVGLGSTLVSGTVPGHEPAGPLRSTEHFGLLEGFDTGYFYVGTSDLWQYAFPAVTRNWPRLADLVYTDLADALVAEDQRLRPVYRQEQLRPTLAPGRLPHDFGGVAEDPFVSLNGYAMRDDPNTWRDANPGFVLGTVLHHRLLGRELSEDTWSVLRAAAEVVAADSAADGVPRHHEFGDSTWDNLGLRGHSTYASALCAGMWAVLDACSAARGQDNGDRARAAVAFEVLGSLWTGEYFRACSEGKYAHAVMPDSLFGVCYADLAGAPIALSRRRIVAHLRAAHRIAHLGYHGGQVGPLLIAEPGAPRYEQDGGEELQVNEVLIGSGWMFAAMLRHYGLDAEATRVAESLRAVLYGGGLQYRSPAAVDATGRFRAPLNMRPLAAWWLEALTALGADSTG